MPPKRTLTPLPPDFDISPGIRKWAEDNGYHNLQRHLDNFKDVAEAKDYRYAIRIGTPPLDGP
jgi:hypothetical protein